MNDGELEHSLDMLAQINQRHAGNELLLRKAFVKLASGYRNKERSVKMSVAAGVFAIVSGILGLSTAFTLRTDQSLTLSPLQSGYIQFSQPNGNVWNVYAGTILDPEGIVQRSDGKYLSVSSEGICSLFDRRGQLLEQKQLPEGTALKPTELSRDKILLAGISGGVYLIDTRTCHPVASQKLPEIVLSVHAENGDPLLKTRSGDFRLIIDANRIFVQKRT